MYYRFLVFNKYGAIKIILLKSAYAGFLDFDIKGGMGFQILFQTRVRR